MTNNGFCHCTGPLSSKIRSHVTTLPGLLQAFNAFGIGANRRYEWFFTFTGGSAGRRSANYSGSFNPWKDDTIGSGEDEIGSGCTSSAFCPGFFSQDGIELGGDDIEARVLCEYTYL